LFVLPAHMYMGWGPGAFFSQKFKSIYLPFSIRGLSPQSKVFSGWIRGKDSCPSS
jgi:hypothetical protein